MPSDFRFRCPICRCRTYDQVAGTFLFACHGCSVVFTNPAAWTAFDPNGIAEGTAGMGGAHRR